MKQTICTLALLVLVGAPFTRAEETSDVKWKKITLSDKFYGEGANFGDFNHDGKMDVVSGPYWYEGPDFNPEKRHEFVTAVVSDPKHYSKNFFEFVGDFNGDGWDDILVVGFPGDAAIWYENPKGKDGPWTAHTVIDHVDNESPQFGDLLKNGKPVLICMSGGKAGYATADASDATKPWTFHPVSPSVKGYAKFTHGLGFGDVNGDGRNDLLVHDGWYEQPSTLDGDPQWTFHKADFGRGGAQMYVYDVNGDGRNDVITSLEAHGFGLAWFEQKTDGTFEKHLIMGKTAEENPQGLKFSQLHAIDMIDVNGDGLMDFITGKRFWAHTTDPEANEPAVLYWFELKRDNGSAHYVGHKIDDNSGVGTQVVARRIDGGKIPSIVVGNKKGTFVFVPETK
jgi:hypothetical protein